MQNFFVRAERWLSRHSASHRSSHYGASIWLQPKVNFRRSVIEQLRCGPNRHWISTFACAASFSACGRRFAAWWLDQRQIQKSIRP